jgi:predicted acetyltransferase
MELDAKSVRFRDEEISGSLRILDGESAAEVIPGIFERIVGPTPGMFERSPGFWKWRILYDPKDWRNGASAIRVVVRSGDDGDDGYAIYRQKEKWDEFLAAGSVNVREVIAATPEAHADLWRFLTNVDLFPNVSYWNLPLDDELPWKVRDPRRLTRSVWDALWLHVLDVPPAMSARAYAHDGVAAFNVADAYFPDGNGTYEIEVSGGVAECRRVSAEAGVTLSAEALGAAYLGGRRLGPAARAGLVKGDTEAINALDRFLSWHKAPWCQEIF